MNVERSISEIRAELREIRELLGESYASANDLVDARYIARRTGLSVRTVREGKAGTDQIPRVLLKADEGKRPLVRYSKGDADRFISGLIRQAQQNSTPAREFRLLRRKRA